MFDIHRLKIFAKVAECRSFTRAAHACFLTQPTVSQHMSALEDYLELTLFDRMGKEVALTQAGEILYRYAKQLDKLSEEALQTIELMHGRRGGRLEISASTIPGEYILPNLLARFKQGYPGLKCSVIIGGTDEALELLDRRSVDIAVVGAKIPTKGLQYTTFIKDELVLIVPRSHRWWDRTVVEMHELIDEPFVMRESGSGTRMTLGRQLVTMKINPERLNIAAVVGSTTAILEMVQAGFGVSLVSRRAAARDIDLGILRAPAIAGADFTRSFYIAQHRRKPSPICKAFVRFLVDHRKGTEREQDKG
jgi:DNA-binding transcriptional LysR family regulator